MFSVLMKRWIKTIHHSMEWCQTHLMWMCLTCPTSLCGPPVERTKQRCWKLNAPSSSTESLQNHFNPSLPPPVKFLGWKTQGRACKQYIFRSYNISFQCYALWWKSFHMPVQKRWQKGLNVSNFRHYWSFLSDIMAVKELSLQRTKASATGTRNLPSHK